MLHLRRCATARASRPSPSLHDALPSLGVQGIQSNPDGHRLAVTQLGTGQLFQPVGAPVAKIQWSGTALFERVAAGANRSEEHTSELQSRGHLVCRLLLETKNSERRTLH